MNAPTYTLEILRLAASLEPPAELEQVDGSARLRAPICGSTVSCAVALDPAGRVERLSQTVSACAFGQASAALVAAHAPGRTGHEIDQGVIALTAWLAGDGDSEPWPGMAALSPARNRPARHGAILLPLRALQAAIEDGSR